MLEEKDDQTLDLEDDQKETVTPQTPPAEPEKDWKAEAERLEAEKLAVEDRYKESSREAQLLHEKNKSVSEQLNKLTNPELPTDDELKQKYPGWDDLSYADQAFLRDQAALNKRQAATEKILMDRLEADKWAEDLATVKSKYPAIASNEADFRAFAYKPSHKNIDVDTLAKAFLFELKPEDKKEVRTVDNGSLLEKTSGGPKEPPKPISAEDISVIRKTDPKRYREMLNSGQIKAEDMI